MAYDEGLAERVRRMLRRKRGVTERRMFGGLAFLLHGNMCCGVLDRDVVLRLGSDGATRALSDPRTRPMDFTGRPLRSMVYVGPAGYRSDADLRAWIDRAVAYARSLPPR
jgi:TfoX/Sxy family transcriptional regulator of competence genes